MHSIQSLAHRAPPAATRTRVRWQPYASTSVVLPSAPPSPSSYLNTPASSITSSPPQSADPQRTRHAPALQSQSSFTTPLQARENPKNKYALGLVDQAVKVLGDIWHPNDIPELFTTTRATASTSLCSDLTLSMAHTSIAATACVPSRNTQLNTPNTPSTEHLSPPYSHDIATAPTTVPKAARFEIEQSPESRKCLVPLRAFVQEVLKRSKTTGSVLQTALCYLEAIRAPVADQIDAEKVGQGVRGEPELAERIVLGTQDDFILEASLSLELNFCPIVHKDSGEVTGLPSDFVMAATAMGEQAMQEATLGTSSLSSPLPPLPPLPSPLLCPRRAFLASLILASKFMQDKSYSNRAWAKLSGLSPREISRCERALGDALGWRLWVGKAPTVDSTAGAIAPARALARCRSESNLAAQEAFLVSSSVLSDSRPMRRAATLPEIAFGQSTTSLPDVSVWNSNVQAGASFQPTAPSTPELSPSSSASSSYGDSLGDKTMQVSFMQEEMTPMNTGLCYAEPGSFDVKTQYPMDVSQWTEDGILRYTREGIAYA